MVLLGQAGVEPARTGLSEVLCVLGSPSWCFRPHTSQASGNMRCGSALAHKVSSMITPGSLPGDLACFCNRLPRGLQSVICEVWHLGMQQKVAPCVANADEKVWLSIPAVQYPASLSSSSTQQDRQVSSGAAAAA